MELLSFSFFLVRTDVFKVLLGRAKPHVVGNRLRRAAQLFISQHPEIRNQMLQMFFFFLFVREKVLVSVSDDPVLVSNGHDGF